MIINKMKGWFIIMGIFSFGVLAEANAKDLDAYIDDLKVYLEKKGITKGYASSEMHGEGLGYYGTSDVELKSYAKSAKSKTDNYINQFKSDDSEKMQEVIEYFSDKKLVIIGESGYGDSLFYCVDDDSFYQFFHERKPVVDLSKKMSLSAIKKEGLNRLKRNSKYVAADKAIGEYRLSKK